MTSSRITLWPGGQAPWVLIDVSFLAYRALHSVGHLEIGDVPSGVVFGLLSQLRSICEDPLVNSNKMVLFFDSGSSYRREAYEDYKRKRHSKKTDEEVEIISEMWTQVHTLRHSLFEKMGVQCLSQEGLESDDLIAFASRQIKKRGETGVIITSDGDLYQCINKNVHWYNPSRKLYYTQSTFKRKHGLLPREWGEVKAIGGCASDNVKGIDGVGEGTAIKYLLGALPTHWKKHKDIESKKGKKIRKRNRPLVVLPHEKTEAFTLEKPSYDDNVFFHFCKRYELVSFLKKRNGWRTFFHGQQPRKRRGK